MKIYYLTQVATRPPTFLVFTDKAGKLHFSAERLPDEPAAGAVRV